MVVWGMLGLNRDLLATFWQAVVDILDYGNDITKMLTTLQEKMTVDFAANVSGGVDAINRTLGRDELQRQVQASFAAVPVCANTASSLLSSTTSLQSGLRGALLPGLAALGAQLGLSLQSRRSRSRQLLSQSPNSTMAVLLPALSSGLPRITGAEDTRADMGDKLQALGDALAGVQTDVSSADSPAVAALQAALAAATLGPWDAALANLTAALQAYGDARSGTMMQAVADDANRILTGAQPLSPSSVAQLTSAAAHLGDQLLAGPYDALQALGVRLNNISNTVVDTGNWTVRLGNGTHVPLPDLVDMLVGSMARLLPFISAADHGSTQAVPTFAQAITNASRVVQALNASVTQLAATATSAAATFARGPDPSAALTQISSALRPALAALSGPTAAVSLALAAYEAAPSAATLAQLRAAAANASGPVGQAAAVFSAPLANATALAATAQAARADVAGLASANVGLQSDLPPAHNTLQGLMDGPLAAWQEQLGHLSSQLGQVPDVAELLEELQQSLDTVVSQITAVTSKVREAVGQAGSQLNETATKVQDNIVDPGFNFVDDKQDITEDMVDIGYPVWMSVWALAALLVLVLALAVYRNWPAGVMSAGLALLVLVLVSQVVTSALAFGMALLGDACDNVELVLMRQAVQRSDDPRIAVVLSYYLYNVPDSQTVMLQAALGLNVTDVRLQLQGVNQTIHDKLDNADGVPLRGLAKAFVSSLGVTAAALLTVFEDVLRLINYHIIHGLYVNTKRVLCCDAGTFAYNQWCAMTAAASLIFGALVSAFYLLARMDMLSERRRSCCSCCTCVCYKPRNEYQAEMEAAEDQFAKEARKQQEILLHQQQLREQALHANQLLQQPVQAAPAGTAAGAAAATAGVSQGPPSGRLSAAGQLRSPAVMPVTYPPVPGAATGVLPVPDAAAVIAEAASAPPAQMTMTSQR